MESLHVIDDLVEGVYRDHAAAATGQLEVRKEIVVELQMIVQSVMPGKGAFFQCPESFNSKMSLIQNM